MSTPTGGRRASFQRVPSRRRVSVSAVVLAVLVLVTGAGLAVAGGSSTPTAVPHDAELTAKPDQRQVVCPSTDVKATSYVGLLPGADKGTVTADGRSLTIPPAGTVTVPAPGPDPLTVTATGEATRGVFATRAKQDSGMTACSSPRASWWFVGAGASPGHFSRLELVNPRTGPAVVNVSVFGANGAVDSPGLRGISIPSGSVKRLKLSDIAPSQGNLAIHVQSSRGLVLADVDDHVLDVLDPSAKPIAEWMPDLAGPTRHLVLSGLPKPGALERSSADLQATPNGKHSGATTTTDPSSSIPPATAQDTLVLGNPSGSEVVAKVRLSTKDGAFTPRGMQPATIPPQSVVSIPLGALVTDPDTSVLVDADHPVVGGYVLPGRTDLVHAVPAVPWTGPAAAALPDGGVRTLLLTAPGAGTTVTVTQLGRLGKQLREGSVVVPNQSTIATQLDPTAGSVVVTSADGKVAGSVLVNRNNLRSALPLTPVLAALRVPAVRPVGR
jgi:hypothetical protein